MVQAGCSVVRISKPRQAGKPGYSTILNHPDRLKIEHDIAIGVPSRTIGHKYGISKDTILRWKNKMPPQLLAKKYANLLAATDDLEQLRIDESEGLLKNLAMQRARILLAQDKAIKLGDLMSIARLSHQVHENIRLVGSYLGEFARRSIETNISLLIQPEYLQLRTALVTALKPFPEARAAVAAVLHRIEGAAAQAPAPCPANGSANGDVPVPAMIDVTPTEVTADA
jgi:hypothetical protein